MRYLNSASWLILACSLLFVTPSSAQPAATTHDRVTAAYNADPSIIYLPDGLDRLKQLNAEVQVAKDATPDDRATAALLYAQALYEKNDSKTALAIVTAAIEQLNAAHGDDSARMGEMLRDQSIYMVAEGDIEAALVIKQRALVLVKKYKGDNSPEAGTILCSMAHAYGLLGRLGDALAAYEAGLALMSADHDAGGKYADPGGYSAYLGNYAGQLRLAGDPQKSLLYSRQALEVAYQMPEGDRAVSWGMFNIASSLLDLGRFGEAEALYRQALDYTVKYGGKVTYETGSYSYNLARALVRQGKYEEGEALLLNAVDILNQVQTNSSPYMLGVVWDVLGQVAYEQGDIALAESRETQSLVILTKLGKRAEGQKANAETDLATALLARGALAEALTHVDAALVFYQREKPPYEKSRVGAEMLRALILARQDQTDQAFSEAIRTRDAMQAHFLSPAVTRGEQADVALNYDLSFTRLADIALTANHPEAAFEAAQLAAFTEVAATSQALAGRAAIADPKTAGLIQQLDLLREKRQTLDRARSFALGKSAEEVKRLDAEIATADITLDKVASDLATAFPKYGELRAPRPLTLAAMQGSLRADQALVIPLAGDDSTLTMVVTRDGLTTDRSPLIRVAVNRDVRRIRAAIDTADHGTTPTFDRAPAWELGHAFFSPAVQTALKGRKDLQILGAGPIMTLPFGLLILSPPQGADADPGALRDTAWLIKSYAVSVRPGLVPDAARAPRRGEGGFAGIGAPLLDAQTVGAPADAVATRGAVMPLPALPQAENELKTMNRALSLPKSLLMTGALATEAQVKAASLEPYSVIAFATHGLVSGDLQALREPALVMTAPAKAVGEDDGLLTASEIAGLRLDADWVILSACNTGSGREIGGAGYSGLARAFLQAGARNVLVSLWPVRDDVAALLGVATVRGYAHGQSEAVALQKATLKLLYDPHVLGAYNPAIWAPFSLVTQ